MPSMASSSDWVPTVGRGPATPRCSGVRYSKWSGANMASRTTATPRKGTRSARTNLSNKHPTNESRAMQEAGAFQLFLHQTIPNNLTETKVKSKLRSNSLKWADFKMKSRTIGSGGTRVWTGDLSICSRMLYHWAIPPWTLGKNVRSKNVRVKNVRLLFKNVRQFSERLAGRFCYLSLTPALVIRSGGSARRVGLKEDGARHFKKKQAC